MMASDQKNACTLVGQLQFINNVVIYFGGHVYFSTLKCEMGILTALGFKGPVKLQLEHL